MRPMSQQVVRFWVVVRKNFVLKARYWQSTVLELLLPVALMGLMVWLRLEVQKQDKAAQSYVASPLNNPTWFGSVARNVSTDFGPFARNLSKLCDAPLPSGLCPEIYSQATWEQRKEHYLGVALDGLLLLHMARYNQQIGIVGSEELADFVANLPGYTIREASTTHSFIRRFHDVGALQSYLSDSSYGYTDSFPQLFGAIDVREVPVRDGDGTYSGNWEVVFRLNATGPGSTDIEGATDVNTKMSNPTNPLSRDLHMLDSRIYWSGGLFLSSGVPLPTGGLVDLQSLLYAWIYNRTGAFVFPSADALPACKCTSTVNGKLTEDFRQCETAPLLLQLLTPYWSTSPGSGGTPSGCLGRFGSIFPMSVREVPFPTPMFTKDTFADVVRAVFGLFFTLLYLWPFTRIMNSLTEDKETKINEVMKMMGLPAEAITIGWYVTYGLLWFIPSLLITLLCWTTVFEHSDKLIILFFFWLFGMCVITLCSLLSVFFERARTASVVGALLLFLLYFPYAFVSTPATSWGQKMLSSLCPPVALSFGVALIAVFESAGVGVQFGNLGDEIENFSMGSVLFVMLIDTCLFAVVAWYLDKVLVVGFGTRQPWNFICSKLYWRPEAFSGLTDSEIRDLEAGFDDGNPANPRYEAVSGADALQRTVMIRDLKKFFKTQDGILLAAVQGLTVNIYSNQIFCLLGHNGAGKTTTISMLSGLLPVDEGDALIYGKSVRKEMGSIRKILGVCPQHDIIWSGLTVKEHLDFYAKIKGVVAANVENEIRSMIAEVGLGEKENALAGTLSGGQKRRLSTGIALIGGSKIVFLDEPSSGVDPFSRRELWTCLKVKKENRTLILTTHHMDEAEELGDRIAIMAAGQIKCVGSSLFLKKQYGVGYTLTITKRSDALRPGNPVLALLKSTIVSSFPNAELLSDAGVELVYRIPMTESQLFPALFEEFERSPERLGVAFFSVSVTTLEEVFLRVGQDLAESDQDTQTQLATRSLVRQLSGSSNADAELRPASQTQGARAAAVVAGAPPASIAGRMAGGDAEMRTPLRLGDGPRDAERRTPSLLKHVYALIVKRYQNAKRDKKAWCCQVGIPLCFLFVALATLKFSNIGAYDAVPLHAHSLPNPQTVEVGAGVGASVDTVGDFMKDFIVDFRVLHNESLSASSFDQYLLDSYYRDDGNRRYAAFRFQSIPNRSIPHPAPVGWVVETPLRPGHAEPSSGLAKSVWPNGFSVPVGTLWDETEHITLNGVDLVVPMSQLNNRLQVDLFWNSSARDAIPIFYHELHNQLLRSSLGAENLGATSIKIWNQPFPLTAAQKDLTDTQTSLFLALGFAFIPASYGAFIVMEREYKSKHLQIISGVNFISYWVATWIWDMINYLVPALLSIVMIAAFRIESLVGAANLPWTILCILLYGFSCTSFTYMLSFAFESHTTAQNLLLIVYLFTGGILEIIAIVLAILPNTQDILKNYLIYIFRLMPNYCLADALTNLIGRQNPLIAGSLGCPLTGCNAYDLNVIGWDLLYMGVGSMIWFSIALGLELSLNTPRLRALLTRTIAVNRVPEVIPDDQDEGLDHDVAEEVRRVRSGAADSEVIVLKGLRKVFRGRRGSPPKVAVRDVYFGVPEGQCFGYLGMNGAGKTTTMKILTGEELCTSGDAFLAGFDIKTSQNQIRRLIGYCPQFDALIGTLTAREHLTLFARIKGVSEAELSNYVESMLDSLTLTPYADRQACTFSGGTKRKLSLGIALVGDPRICFLDEPTTGVDPESRRFLWTLISTTMRGRSVILTTHSMDECEALCSRIGIMVNGRLVCLGSAAQLKVVHGSGYQLDVSLCPNVQDRRETFQKLSAFVSKTWSSSARLIDGGDGKIVSFSSSDAVPAPLTTASSVSQRAKFRLPKETMPISNIFRTIEEHKEYLELAEYSISETTLDQIFITFAKHQLVEDENAAAARRS